MHYLTAPFTTFFTCQFFQYSRWFSICRLRVQYLIMIELLWWYSLLLSEFGQGIQWCYQRIGFYVKKRRESMLYHETFLVDNIMMCQCETVWNSNDHLPAIVFKQLQILSNCLLTIFHYFRIQFRIDSWYEYSYHQHHQQEQINVAISLHKS